MIPFSLVYFGVLTITVLSGAAAMIMVLLSKPTASTAQRQLVERLSQIALVGAGTIFALLGTAQPS